MPEQAMAFYHQKGLVPTWNLAQQYIADGGRIATLPDIIDARLATKPRSTPWETYFTTLSAEYVGIGRDGRKIIIVAHGIGPMSTLDGILAAYKHHYGDKTRRNTGGRINIEEFRKLEDGVYGKVFIVDHDDYVSQYEYPYMELLRASQAYHNPLLRARLGGGDRADLYVDLHAEFARAEAQTTDGQDPFVLTLGDASNCPYTHLPIGEDEVLAHLLSIGGLSLMNHSDHGRNTSLTTDISAHEWWNGCRFAAVPKGDEMASIHPGWDLHNLMRAQWRELMVVVPKPPTIGLRPLKRFGDSWFTMYPEHGHSMASHEPEFLVTDMESIGESVEFVTEIHGYYGFFRYDVQEVKAIAPPGANGFFMGEPALADDNHHKTMVTFYRTKVDTSRRMRRQEDIEGDYAMQARLQALSESATTAGP